MNIQRKRRPSISRIVKELRAAGEHVIVEQDADGTTRIICGGKEEGDAPTDYWDRKLKQ